MARRILVLARQHVIAVVALFMALGGTSYAMVGATSASDSKTLYACITERYKTLNLTTATAKCPSGQRKISFNAKGERGAAGAAGVAGAAGAVGPAGPKGETGERGPAAPSVLGSPGTKGDTGPKGDTGASGPKGDTGTAGAAGPKGDTGATGAAGAAGPKGDTGATGAAGPVGATGATGPAGPTLVSSGIVEADGRIILSAGPQPTIARTAAGNYSLKISGLGGGCVLPQLTAVAHSVVVSYGGGSCGVGSVDTTVFTADGQDHQWSYLMVGTAPAPAAAARQSFPPIPARG